MFSKTTLLLPTNEQTSLAMSNNQNSNNINNNENTKLTSNTLNNNTVIDWDANNDNNDNNDNNNDNNDNNDNDNDNNNDNNDNNKVVKDKADTDDVLCNSFDKMGINDEVLRCIYQNGFEHPTRPQRAIKTVIKNSTKNYIFEASTGSGKTLAYLIPVAHSVNTNIKKTQVIIIVPSRDLATQIYNNAKKLFNDSNISVALHRGTRPKNSDNKSDGDKYMTTKLAHKGTEHIVIGTPGRLLHLLNEVVFCNPNTSIKIDSRLVHQIVLDECDKQLATSDESESNMARDVHEIINTLPFFARQLLFSATLSTNVTHYANQIDAVVMQFISKKSRVDHYFIAMQEESTKLKYLERIINDISNVGSTFIFASSIVKVMAIYEYLKDKNFAVGMIHSTLSMRARDTVLQQLGSTVRILVATNIIGRGIDIPSVDLVFNYDLIINRPGDRDNRRNNDTDGAAEYMHCSGRAGRSEKHGASIVFIVQSTNSVEKPRDILTIESLYHIEFNNLPDPSTMSL